jgi:hypothetical protein
MYETLSDGDALYAFYNLPSGRYEFSPDLPEGTTLSWYIGSDDPLTPFELNAGGCQQRDIEVFPSGSIQGRVLDSSSKPLPHAFVYIVPAGQKVLPKERQLYWASQGKDSFFKFVHIPPGNYLILVNPDDEKNPKFPYRRTFYPGVRDRQLATTIAIRGGEQIKGADIPLLPEFAPRHLTVRVTWSDGRLIRDLVFIEAKGTENPSAMAHPEQVDQKASVVDLMILPNEPYRIEAKLICRYEDDRSIGPGATLRSNAVYLGPKEDRTELSLAIPAKACPEISGKTLLTEQ